MTAPPFWCSESEEAFRAKVADVAREAVAPRVADMDRAGCYDPAVLAALTDAGLMGIEVPESYGGLGGDLFSTILAIEELAAVDPAVAVLVDVQNALVVSALCRHGTADQRRRFLPRLAGGAVGAFALSEPETGSDAFALSTVAEPDGSGHRLSGTKAWVTNGREADVLLVCARAGGAGSAGLGLFLVERGAAGVTVADPVEKLGIRASSTCEVELDGVAVPAHDVLGPPGGGAQLVVDALVVGKLGIAAQLLGLARGALEHAVRYAGEREQFGRRIGEYQAVRFPLARLAVEIDAARLLLYATTRAAGEPDPAGRLLRDSSGAKLLASDLAERAASQAVETFGGVGFTTRSPVEKLYRDAKVGAIYEGTTNMQLRTVSATVLPVPEATAPVPDPPKES